jgi:hypothetical protein
MIYNESNFKADLPAGYDGRFDWDVFKSSKCFGETKIEPMDFDGVVERKQNYLIFESKDLGKCVPKGQSITLNNLRVAKSFTVVTIWPKSPPFHKMDILYQSGALQEILGHDNIIEKIKSWYLWADRCK